MSQISTKSGDVTFLRGVGQDKLADVTQLNECKCWVSLDIGLFNI